ncbi:MAG: amidotransferase, partial [Cyanobium sp.]
VHLARSEACAHQAFQVGSRTIGLQCHLETTPAAVEALIRHCGEELVADRFVQSEAELRAVTLDHCGEANALMEQVLAWLLREPEAREA